VRFGLTPAVNALATIMLGVTMVAAAITAVVLRRSRAQAVRADNLIHVMRPGDIR
jgi:ABC-type spermidine/putrescine transport system permease subunit II